MTQHMYACRMASNRGFELALVDVAGQGDAKRMALHGEAEAGRASADDV